ncbi:hypothetical protein [Ancrocorticia sp.]|uniref:hypothetical protein n=1 Tax=Ancrocorticia sp. TaxID=2593684 RepID=UPI003F8E834C
MSDEQPLADDRTSTHGWPWVLLCLLAVGAVLFTWRGIVASTQEFVDGDIPAAVLTLVADVSWLAGAIGLLHNGRKMRIVAALTWTINVVAPIFLLFMSHSQIVPVSPWFDGGSTYFYLPTIGAVAALVWLVWSSPSHIATRNGG